MFTLILISLLSSSKCFEFVFKPGPLVPSTKGEIWPKPQHEVTSNGTYFSLQPDKFQFIIAGNKCEILTEALMRYQNIIVRKNRYLKDTRYYKKRSCTESSDSKYLGFLQRLEVVLKVPCKDTESPSIDMKEEYVLNVTSTVQRLSSDSIWGILRGLETFSQLIYLSDDLACLRVRTTSIRDYPRFAHRGILLDTSRHYQQKDDILRLLDAMSFNKMNVFHWHITDDYSFPYVSKKFPELSNGAFHPLMVYDQDFVKEIQEYARNRGIRIVVELDTPGHTLSWGVSNPDLLTKCRNLPQLEYGPMDPTKNSTYNFIFKLYEEIKQVFKDDYVHLGGDEVDFSCWESNTEIKQFMNSNNIKDYASLQNYYTKKLIDYVTSLGMRSIVWEEASTSGTLPKKTIVNVWRKETTKQVLSNLTSSGYPVILSSYWYLDNLASGGDWLKYYNEDPQDFEGTDEQKKLILGAEATMWTEVVDETNLEPRIWPRASVAAEKFWSPRDPKRSTIAELYPIASRLQEQTCRMRRRGVRAQPPTGPSVCF